MTQHQPTIWTLLDPSPGHANQARGVAEALGLPFVEKQLVYSTQANTPNRFKFPFMGVEAMGLNLRASSPMQPPWPDIVIACGRKSAPIAQYIKKKAKSHSHETRHVQIMWPGGNTKGIDLIAIPTHDQRRVKAHKGQVILTILGAPHRITRAQLAEAQAEYRKTFQRMEKPILSVLIGGATGRNEFTYSHGQQLAEYLTECWRNTGGQLAISTSPRTPNGVIEALKKYLPEEAIGLFYQYGDDAPNPYMAMLGYGDALVVTGDSISMLSEACGTGKLVCIFAPDGFAPEKHTRFHSELIRQQYALPFEASQLPTIAEIIRKDLHRKTPLNAAETVAEVIRDEGWI